MLARDRYSIASFLDRSRGRLQGRTMTAAVAESSAWSCDCFHLHEVAFDYGGVVAGDANARDVFEEVRNFAIKL